MDKLYKNGMTQEAFERTRDFLSKFVNVLTKSKRAELGYAIDSNFYGTNPYNQFLKDQLAKVTLDDVNRLIKRYVRTDRLTIAIVAKDGEALKAQLLSDDPSPMTYNSPKPDAILEEDKIVERWPLKLKPEDIVIRPANQVFQ
jgi:zinc protease